MLLNLKLRGWLSIVVTNQPDIARGIVSLDFTEEIHQRLFKELNLDDILVCPHDDSDECTCRKPKPGALLAAALKHDVDLSESYMIGDRWRDIEAGVRAGCRSIFVDYDYAETRPQNYHLKVSSPIQAIAYILENAR